nr:xylulose kinase-1 [Tanacetum cinerariifolium]
LDLSYDVVCILAITVSLVTNSPNTSSSILFHPNNPVIMARLAFCDYHNMVAILEKYEQNTNFHQIVDFVGASHIRYALTFNPTIYVSHIRQFSSTIMIETTDEGTKILATVDGILRTVTESSIRRNLKLNDEEGLKFNEFSSNIATALVCLATNRTYIFSKMIFDGMVKNVNNKVLKFLMYPRANIAKTSTLTYESTSRVTSLAADEGNLQLCFQELTNFCTSLQRQQYKLVSKFATQALEITDLKARVKFLEDRQGEGINLSKDDAPIKGRRLDEKEVATERVSSDTEEIRRDEGEVVAERVSDDTKEMATVLIIMDAASVLSNGGVQVVPTAAAVAPANLLHTQGERENKRWWRLIHPRRRRDNKSRWTSSLPENWKRSGVSKISEGEAAWLKRKGIRSEQESAKKQKTSEEVPEKVKSSDEVPEEKIKELIQLVPIEEVYVEALQVKHPIIDWKVHTEGQRSYWKIKSWEAAQQVTNSL